MSAAELRPCAELGEVRSFPSGRLRSFKIGSGEGGRFTMKLGWRWSDGRKPIANTESREAHRFQHHVSGRFGDCDDLAIVMVGGGWHPR
jgi:hypothetical protein